MRYYRADVRARASLRPASRAAAEAAALRARRQARDSALSTGIASGACVHRGEVLDAHRRRSQGAGARPHRRDRRSRQHLARRTNTRRRAPGSKRWARRSMSPWCRAITTPMCAEPRTARSCTGATTCAATTAAAEFPFVRRRGPRGADRAVDGGADRAVHGDRTARHASSCAPRRGARQRRAGRLFPRRADPSSAGRARRAVFKRLLDGAGVSRVARASMAPSSCIHGHDHAAFADLARRAAAAVSRRSACRRLGARRQASTIRPATISIGSTAAPVPGAASWSSRGVAPDGDQVVETRR